MNRILFIIGLLILFNAPAGIAQYDTLRLSNASFEGVPFEGDGNLNTRLPRGCFDCGFVGESPPDVQPVYGGAFQVTKPPHDGDTYIGLVVRDNDTWERFSQKMNAPMIKGQCYKFSIYLARSEIYMSYSRQVKDSMIQANYVTPAKLRIYGGNAPCDRTEMLGETSLVRNTRWLKYSFQFEPINDYSYLVFEAFYNTPTLVPYNGNILVDDASPIIEIPCEGEEPPLADAGTKKEPKINTSPSKPRDTPNLPIAENTTVEEPKIMKELDPEKVVEGQTIRIDKLFFVADSTNMTPDSYAALDEVYDFMKSNSNIVIEIGGHTNTIPPHDYCDKLSRERAKSVADYLNRKGINGQRLRFKGYGKRKPLTKDQSQSGRKINQRVELKILSVNG